MGAAGEFIGLYLGITLLEIIPLNNQRFSLFSVARVEMTQSDKRMVTLDVIKGRNGRGAWLRNR